MLRSALRLALRGGLFRPGVRRGASVERPETVKSRRLECGDVTEFGSHLVQACRHDSDHLGGRPRLAGPRQNVCDRWWIRPPRQLWFEVGEDGLVGFERVDSDKLEVGSCSVVLV